MPQQKGSKDGMLHDKAEKTVHGESCDASRLNSA
jgi:hypothetical protein